MFISPNLFLVLLIITQCGNLKVIPINSSCLLKDISIRFVETIYQISLFTLSKQIPCVAMNTSDSTISSTLSWALLSIMMAALLKSTIMETTRIAKVLMQARPSFQLSVYVLKPKTLATDSIIAKRFSAVRIGVSLILNFELK